MCFHQISRIWHLEVRVIWAEIPKKLCHPIIEHQWGKNHWQKALIFSRTEVWLKDFAEKQRETWLERNIFQIFARLDKTLFIHYLWSKILHVCFENKLLLPFQNKLSTFGFLGNTSYSVQLFNYEEIKTRAPKLMPVLSTLVSDNFLEKLPKAIF